MQDRSAEKDVEGRVTKGQCLGTGGVEGDVEFPSSCFLSCARDHLVCGVDGVHGAAWADAPLDDDGEASGSTADIENRLADDETCELDQLLSEAALVAARDDPQQGVVVERAVDDPAGTGRV